uniref:Uncharacterized protein n=1 Tax=Anguilla anguilla TaxID=7936 RepID=A0A0E9RNW2_ANGAN
MPLLCHSTPQTGHTLHTLAEPCLVHEY